MPMPLELSLASPTLNRVMGPPNPHPAELSPSTQSALPPCSNILPRDSPSAHLVTADSFNLPNHIHFPRTYPSQQSACATRARSDEPRMPPSSVPCKAEIAIDDISLTLALAHDTAASSNDSKRVWRSRELGSTNCSEHMSVPDFDLERTLNEGSSRGSEDEDGRSTARKKLRLSKEESALLEERFKEHSTLTPKQKSALAKQLNLRPRQVEVWFQNRRARTKLKQTEVDFEMLKKCCASLTEENRRLQMEVAQLRALKMGPHSVTPNGLHIPMMVPEATLLMCPQCQCISTHAVAPSSSTTTSNSSLHEAPTCPLALSQQQKNTLPAPSG